MYHGMNRLKYKEAPTSSYQLQPVEDKTQRVTQITSQYGGKKVARFIITREYQSHSY